MNPFTISYNSTVKEACGTSFQAELSFCLEAGFSKLTVQPPGDFVKLQILNW